MSATTAKGAKENLEQYTAVRLHVPMLPFGTFVIRTNTCVTCCVDQGNRHTGSTGDYEMAKYIRSKAIDFGIEDSQIKLDEFEILMNEPEALRIELGHETNETSTVFDLMASFKTKKNARVPVRLAAVQSFRPLVLLTSLTRFTVRPCHTLVHIR